MRLIDGDEARRRVVAFATGLHSEVLPVDAVVMLLAQETAVDAVPARFGVWIEDDYGFNRCSECGREWDEPEYKTLFCPGCGASMEVE